VALKWPTSVSAVAVDPISGPDGDIIIETFSLATVSASKEHTGG